MLPILFQNNNFILYSYPLLMGLAWGIGYQIFFHHIEDSARMRAQILFWGVFISAWLGAKILFLITSAHNLAQVYLTSSSFWLGGGFVFYGGLLGGIAFILIFQIWIKIAESWIKWGMVALALSHGIGRIGCFLAGCCYGEVTQLWWGIHLHGEERHPTQLIEAISLMLLAWVLAKIERPRSIVATYALSYGALRFVLEEMRADKLRGLWAFNLTPSQWLALFSLLMGLYLLTARPRDLSK